MEVIDKERKNALLSIYSGYEPQPEPQLEPLPEPQRNHNHQFKLWTPKYVFGFGFGFVLYLDRASLTKQFGDFQDYKTIYRSFCLYVINHDCDAPFVQYILAKNGQSYEFPKTVSLLQHTTRRRKQRNASFNNFVGIYATRRRTHAIHHDHRIRRVHRRRRKQYIRFFQLLKFWKYTTAQIFQMVFNRHNTTK
jgi:hypothetical protein